MTTGIFSSILAFVHTLTFQGSFYWTLSTVIELFGTTDNYTTEYTERLHIDLAKDAYRATNMKTNIRR